MGPAIQQLGPRLYGAVTRTSWLTGGLLATVVSVTGCVPVPVSMVPLHPRVERTPLVETEVAANGGNYSRPAFDRWGETLATYDSGLGQIRLLRAADLSQLNSHKPARWPRRISFSPQAGFLVIEGYSGWQDDFLRGKPVPHGGNIHSEDATQDDIQRVEVWNLRTGRAILDLSCDQVIVGKPQGGWLWAKDTVVVRGFRSSPVLAAYFSGDEKVFTLLCRDGTRQRWNSESWNRLEDLPPPPLWNPFTGFGEALVVPQNRKSPQENEVSMVLRRIGKAHQKRASLLVLNPQGGEERSLPGICSTSLQAAQAVSGDVRNYAAICIGILSHELRAWDLDAEEEVPLEGGSFGLTSGAPPIRGPGLALSPDGSYLAAAAIDLVKYLLVTPVPTAAFASARSDLRLWRREPRAGWRELDTVSLDDLAVNADYLRGVDLTFSPDGSILAAAGARLRLYRMSDLAGGPDQPH